MASLSHIRSKSFFFAGREWEIKDSGTGRAGPGGQFGNFWSENNAYLDTDDNTLVLQLSKNSQGLWTCAEVKAVEHTSYGEHKYYISGRPDLNHPYVVFGTFLYKEIQNDPNNYNVREIDIEFAKFGNDTSTNNGGFAMHRDGGGTPYWENKFIANLDNTNDLTTTYYNWTDNSVAFRVHKGIDGEIITNGAATYTPDANSISYYPKENDYLKMHINYWIFGGYDENGLFCNYPSNATPPVIKISNVIYPPVHYDANYNFNADKTIKLREIICNATINSGRNITFEVSQSAELGAGFEVQAGGTLNININTNSGPQQVKRYHNTEGNNTDKPAVAELKPEKAMLYQNYPNPFSAVTTIPVYIPEKINSARLVVYDLFGRQVKSEEITNRGNVPVEFQNTSLSNGLYYYSLYIDSNLIASNKMILKK
jgi:Beta-glucanase/Beta-glucan synthetase